MNEVPFTFGIVTNAASGITQELINSVATIRELHIPEHEIIIVGTASVLRSHPYINSTYPNLKIIDFDENVRPGWITKKKNLITQHASYDNVVYLHDYILFKSDWYEGFKRFGNDFEICMTKMINFHEEKEDNRFRDWVMFPEGQIEWGLKAIGADIHDCLLPYGETQMQPWQYISGAYWVAKKHIMQRFPLNEALVWGQGEDLDFSRRVRAAHKFSMNTYSTVKVGKPNNHRIFELISDDNLNKLKRYLKI